MDFLHYKINGDQGDLVRVKISNPAYVRMMDPMNFNKYQIGNPYNSLGGFCEREIAEFEVPYKGNFHVTVDLNGAEGLVKAQVDILRFH
jgi:hypothetical protein